jgi:four helix bundle protein
MNSEELRNRTKEFAHRCVRLASALPNTDLGRLIRGQLMRSSTSVAANYRATCLAQTKAVFASKLSITLEEADESAFWLEFLMDEKLVAAELVRSLHAEALELTRIFAASRKTSMCKKV